MERLGLTVQTVAEESGLHFNTVYRFLSGRAVNRSTLVLLRTYRQGKQAEPKAIARPQTA